MGKRWLVAALLAGAAAVLPETLWAGETRPTTQPAQTLAVKEKVLSGAIGTTVAMSPDGRRIAYSLHRGDKWLMAVDGQETKQSYDDIGNKSAAFSPDGKRVAYSAKRGDKWLVVVDGEEGKEYEQVMAGPPVFSPDSKSVACCAKRAGKWVLVVNGKEYEESDDFAPGSLAFSADSTQAACVMWRQGKLLVVTETGTGPLHDQISTGPPTLSADGRNVAYWAMRGKKWVLAVNGNESKEEYDAYISGAHPIFVAPDRVQAHAIRGEEHIVVEAEVPKR